MSGRLSTPEEMVRDMDPSAGRCVGTAVRALVIRDAAILARLDAIGEMWTANERRSMDMFDALCADLRGCAA